MTRIMDGNDSVVRRVSWESVKKLRRKAELHAAEVHVEHWPVYLENMPVDATVVAERLGANVFWADLDDENLDGFIYMPRARIPEITINEKSSPVRRRFTTAHEAGHLVYAREVALPDKTGFVDGDETLGDEALDGEIRARGEEARNGTSEEEIYANAFAAALLMPRNLVVKLRDAGKSVREMSRVFRVSESAMSYRIKNLSWDEIA